jgi:mono/diheme cytochrome c family protein
MSRAVVNFFLLLAFVASLGLHVLLGRDLSRRNFEILPEMAYSPAYDTNAPNPNFPDGKTLQLPQPGTIPRGRLPLHYGPSPEDAARAGAELHNPFSGEAAIIVSAVGQAGSQPNPWQVGWMARTMIAASADDARARERGAFLYANYCQMCHGPEGKGDGPLVQRGIPPSASLRGENAIQMKDGQLFHVLTHGQRNMSAHAAQLSREDRWKVILHVRSLQQKAAGEKRP